MNDDRMLEKIANGQQVNQEELKEFFGVKGDSEVRHELDRKEPTDIKVNPDDSAKIADWKGTKIEDKPVEEQPTNTYAQNKSEIAKELDVIDGERIKKALLDTEEKKPDEEVEVQKENIDSSEEEKKEEEEREKTLNDYIMEEFKNSGVRPEDLNVQEFMKNVGNSVPESERNTESYRKLMRLKERFDKAINFNFLLDYRLNEFFIPKKYKTIKEQKKFLKQYNDLAYAKLKKSKHNFIDPFHAFHNFSQSFTKKEYEAAHNFFIVLCHFIYHHDLDRNAYYVMYTLNRMNIFSRKYAQEEYATSADLDNKALEGINCHAVKQLIIDNYSGKIYKWKKGKITPPSLEVTEQTKIE